MHQFSEIWNDDKFCNFEIKASCHRNGSFGAGHYYAITFLSFQKHCPVCLAHQPAKLLCQHVDGMTRMKERGARAGFGWRVMNHFCPCITLATATSELAFPHQDIGIKEVEAPEVCFKDGVKKLSG